MFGRKAIAITLSTASGTAIQNDVGDAVAVGVLDDDADAVGQLGDVGDAAAGEALQRVDLFRRGGRVALQARRDVRGDLRGQQRAHDGDADRARDRAEEVHVRARGTQLRSGSVVLHDEREVLHDHAEAGAEHDHVDADPEVVGVVAERRHEVAAGDDEQRPDEHEALPLAELADRVRR